MRLVERHDSASYRKGLVIERRSDAVVQLMSLTIDHPGTLIEGGGVEKGWFFNIDTEGVWHRAEHPEQCSCNNPLRHQQLFWSLHAFAIIEVSGPIVPLELHVTWRAHTDFGDFPPAEDGRIDVTCTDDGQVFITSGGVTTTKRRTRLDSDSPAQARRLVPS